MDVPQPPPEARGEASESGEEQSVVKVDYAPPLGRLARMRLWVVRIVRASLLLVLLTVGVLWFRGGTYDVVGGSNVVDMTRDHASMGISGGRCYITIGRYSVPDWLPLRFKITNQPTIWSDEDALLYYFGFARWDDTYRPATARRAASWVEPGFQFTIRIEVWLFVLLAAGLLLLTYLPVLVRRAWAWLRFQASRVGGVRVSVTIDRNGPSNGTSG